MAKHHKLELTEDEIQTLVDLRDKGEPAYLRERATALLKIHEGFSPHEVAHRGLLKKRDPDTVYAWLRRYREHGISGLSNKPGRGRKPAFSPKSPEEAGSELLVAIGQDPGSVNEHQTRWTLRSLGQVVPWLEGLSLPGIHQIFSRLGLSYKRAREYLRSPDTDYAEKLSRIKQALEEARENPETCVVVYQDEFGFNLQPSRKRLGGDGDEMSFGTPELSPRGDLLWHRGAQPTHRRCCLSASQKLHGCRTPYILHPDLPTLSKR